MCRLPKATGRSVQSLCPWAVCNDSINNVGSRGPSRLWRRKPTKGLGGKEPNMLIIGCDWHPELQQIACVDTETGELEERRLAHREEAEQFYQELKQQNVAVRVGMESSGHARWFERLLRQLEFELWIGDAAEIRTKRVRKQKTDRQDAQLLLRLMMEDRFPRIWVPDAANRDMRQLLWHRHRLVQMRTRVMNQLHVVALNEGVRRKKALWRPAGRQDWT